MVVDERDIKTPKEEEGFKGFNKMALCQGGGVTLMKSVWVV